MNGDRIEDIVIGGSNGYSPQLLLQLPNGKFNQRSLISNANGVSKPWHDMGILLFDADGDKVLDLYVCAGGYENADNSSNYQDKLFIIDGKGNFTLDSTALPVNHAS